MTKHEPPRVTCKQARSNYVPAVPADDQWVEWVPPSQDLPQGAARLSEPAVVFVTGVLAELAKERSLRDTEHECLDRAEDAGDIRQ